MATDLHSSSYQKTVTGVIIATKQGSFDDSYCKGELPKP